MDFGALIAQMFSTVIGPALPTIKDGLGLGLSAQTWTITAYSLAFEAALVAGGQMGDLVGEVTMIGISLPACNTASMSAVDPERAGMGSELMQMTFNIPAAFAWHW